MNAVLLRHVSAPPKMLYAAPRLLMLEFLLGMILGALFLNPLAAIVLWLVSHPVAILITLREPHTDAYLQAWGSYRHVPNHWQTPQGEMRVRVYVS
jgi:type IV secretory pathway TrbD component|nr:hypothetical protein [uncultured Dongia sp.]